MQRLLYVLSFLLVVSGLLIAASRLLGSARPLPADSIVTLLAHDTQLIGESWCWQTICPGVQPMEQTVEKFQAVVSGANCEYSSLYQGARVGAYDAAWKTIFSALGESCAHPADQLLLGGWFGDHSIKGRRLGDMMLHFGAPTFVAVYNVGAGGWTFAVAFPHDVMIYVTKIGAETFSLLPADPVDYILLFSADALKEREDWFVQNALPRWQWRGFGINKYNNLCVDYGIPRFSCFS